MARHNEIGKIGEEIAGRYLEKNSFKIIERNFRHFLGEIDIVAEKNGKIYFCEVKSVSRTNIDSDFGFRPEENLHSDKLRKFYRIIDIYISQRNIKGEWGVFLVTVKYSSVQKKAKVEMIPVINS